MSNPPRSQFPAQSDPDLYQALEHRLQGDKPPPADETDAPENEELVSSGGERSQTEAKRLKRASATPPARGSAKRKSGPTTRRLPSVREAQTPPKHVAEERAHLLTEAAEYKARSRESFRAIIVNQWRSEWVRCREEATRTSARLGSVTVERTPSGWVEVWEDGQTFHLLNQRQEELTLMRESFKQGQKALTKQKALVRSGTIGDMPPPPSPSNAYICIEPSALTRLDDILQQEEVLKMGMAWVKKEEADVGEQRERLDVEKQLLVREMRRIRDETASKFSTFPVLHQRYQLCSLLGKGGFSEVWRAFDLESLDYVAVKIHQLNTQWIAAKKESYVKHALRECKIHSGMNHPRVVKLHDVFEIDRYTFATVLEFCKGQDLDEYLKQRKSLPEREARIIISQVLSGLRYLHTGDTSIIHYDLKPGNILFVRPGSLEVKLTDFGLSKILDTPMDDMELTSQGAGTYWYLPPECFVASSRITSKVDVFSAGVVLFQMLFNRKPFGDGMTQQQVFQTKTMLIATHKVEIPPKPVVSSEAKDFLQRCLAHDLQLRMDVSEALEHPFLAPFMPRTTDAM